MSSDNASGYGNVEFNGWTNWATWNVVLWIDNEEGWHEARRDAIRSAGSADPEAIADLCRELMGNATPDGCDLSHQGIDWASIAERWAEELDD